MKQQIKVLTAALGLAVLSGCASVSTPVTTGLIYTKVNHSGLANGGVVNERVKAVKTGVSECTNVLGLISTGDCSQEAAMKNGGIGKIHSTSHTSTTVFGIFSKYETIVIGE